MVELAKESAQAYIIDRVSYVASFADKARSTGANYLLKQTVTDIAVQPDYVEIRVEDAHGIQTLKAKAAIIGGGFGSKLTRRVGLGCVKDFTAGVQAEVIAPDLDQVQVYFGREVAPYFFAWLVPTTSQRALVGLLAQRHAHHYLNNFIVKLQAEGKVTTITKEPTHWGVPLRPLPRTFGHRVLVVGDAAGQVKPATGGGIYYALLAGEIAAESLHRAFSRGDLSASQLSYYEKGWKALLSREIAIGYAARRFFGILKDGQIDSLMGTIAANGIRSDILNSKELSFDWHGGVIMQALNHPVLGSALRFLNPLAIRLATRIATN